MPYYYHETDFILGFNHLLRHKGAHRDCRKKRVFQTDQNVYSFKALDVLFGQKETIMREIRDTRLLGENKRLKKEVNRNYQKTEIENEENTKTRQKRNN